MRGSERIGLELRDVARPISVVQYQKTTSSSLREENSSVRNRLLEVCGR